MPGIWKNRRDFLFFYLKKELNFPCFESFKLSQVLAYRSIAEKRRRQLFILLWEADHLVTTKHFINVSNTASKSFGISINFRNIFLTEVMTESFVKKYTNKITKSSKKKRKQEGTWTIYILLFYLAYNTNLTR